MPLTVTNVSKDYPTRTGPLSVLRGVRFSLDRGEALAIMGPSGSGKSTLLHILGTLDTPTAGTVALENTNPFAPPGTGTGGIPQPAHRLRLPGSPPVAAMFGAGERPRPHTGQPRHAARGDGDVRPEVARTRGPGGTARPSARRTLRRRTPARRRRAALVLKPVLLLADEPTGNLDRKNAESVGELLMDLHRQENNILVVVTHSADLAKLLPRRMEVNDGTLTAIP